MKLTRRDFLKSGAITAAAVAVGLRPKIAGGYVTETVPVDGPGCILPEQTLADFMAGAYCTSRFGYPDGGYLVPVVFHKQLIALARTQSPIVIRHNFHYGHLPLEREA